MFVSVGGASNSYRLLGFFVLVLVVEFQQAEGGL